MEIINFKTRFDIGQRVFAVFKNGEICAAIVKGVIFSHAPMMYDCYVIPPTVESEGGNIPFEESDMYETFEDAIKAAEPLWIAEQKIRCNFTN